MHHADPHQGKLSFVCSSTATVQAGSMSGHVPQQAQNAIHMAHLLSHNHQSSSSLTSGFSTSIGFFLAFMMFGKVA